MRSPGLFFAALAVAVFGVLSPADAATTLTSSVTSADGELTTTFTWESTQRECVASGHPSWDGAKPPSGTLQLPTITMSGTYTLTLTCTTPAQRTARLTWQNPTQNTDGSALTNLAGIRVHYGRSADALVQSIDVTPPAETYTVQDLAVGQWFFAVRAFNTTGVESALSDVLPKTITEGTSEVESVTLTVNPIPKGVAGFDVE